jgi:hypothetical protein
MSFAWGVRTSSKRTFNPVIRSADIIVTPLTNFFYRKIKPMKITASLALLFKKRGKGVFV